MGTGFPDANEKQNRRSGGAEEDTESFVDYPNILREERKEICVIVEIQGKKMIEDVVGVGISLALFELLNDKPFVVTEEIVLQLGRQREPVHSQQTQK